MEHVMHPERGQCLQKECISNTRVEHKQFQDHVWRNALSSLEADSLNVFNETIDFSIESSVPDPFDLLIVYVGRLIHTPLIRKTLRLIFVRIFCETWVNMKCWTKVARLDQEQEREQQQEQQREVKARRDQEIEGEIDQAYRRRTRPAPGIPDLYKLAESEQFYPVQIQASASSFLGIPWQDDGVIELLQSYMEWSSTYQELYHGVGCIGYETIRMGHFHKFSQRFTEGFAVESFRSLQVRSSRREHKRIHKQDLIARHVERLIRGYLRCV